jgi:gliding motility-associated-like protein
LGNIGLNLVVNDYNGFGVSCAGECDGEILAVVSGGTAPLTYAWSTGSTAAGVDELCPGTYSVTVTDAAGNSAVASATLTEPLPIDIVLTGTLPSDFGTSDGAIFAVVNGGNPPYEYEWFGPVTGNTAALINIPAGVYTLLVTDESGCTESASEQLLPGNTPCFQAITVFTPNSDGRNDFFIITCVLDTPNRLYIFNRSGAPVYETTDYQNTWTGADGDGQPLPDGGYFWVLEVYPSPGTVQTYRGTVNLLRTAD